MIVTAGAELANVSDQADFLPRVDEAVETLAERGLGGAGGGGGQGAP